MEIEQSYSPLTPETQAEIAKHLGDVYWKASKLVFNSHGMELTSEDQGGHPFIAVRVHVVGSPAQISEACLRAAQGIRGAPSR